MEGCNNEVSHLDWLWEQLGGRIVENNPNDARDSDLLNKQGIVRLLNEFYSNSIVDITKEQNESKPNLWNIVIHFKDGTTKTAFTIGKEQYLVKVNLRKTTQNDVDEGLATNAQVLCLEYVMNNGRTFITELPQLMYHGVRTNGIETSIAGDGGIEAYLRIADSNETGISVELTRNGLLIQTVISPAQGQSKLVKKDCGLAVENKWDNGDNIKFMEMTWAEYQNLTLENPVVEGDGVCEVLQTGVEKGCIYFIKDKRMMILNGAKYGFITGDSDTVYTTVNENGEYVLNVRVSAQGNNLIHALEDGLFCALSWSGSKHNEYFRIQCDPEENYKQLSETDKSRTIFFCIDTNRVYVAGKRYDSVDIIGSQNDSNDGETVYGYINMKVRELKSDIETSDKRIDTAMSKANSALEKAESLEVTTSEINDTISEIGIEQLGNLSSFNDLADAAANPDICNKQSNVIIPFTITSSEGKENGFIFNVITLNGINQALFWKNADRPSLKRTLIVSPDGTIASTPFHAIDYEVNMSVGNMALYNLKGMTTETDSDTVKEAFKDIYSSIYIDDKLLDKCLAKGYTLSDLLFKDKIMISWSESSYMLSLIGRKNPNGPFMFKSAFVSISDGVYKIVKPYEEKTLLFTEDLESNPTISDITANVELINETLENKVDLVDISTDENPNRKAIVMKNHDTLLGTAKDGTTYNLAMISKWDKTDYGTSKLPINLNGSGERPTYNDKYELALTTDTNKVNERINGVVDTISQVQVAVATNNETISTVQKGVNDLGVELKNKYQQLETTVNNNKSAVDSEISSIKSAAEATNQALESLRTTVVDANLESMKTTIESLRQSIEQLTQRVRALEEAQG